MLPAKGSEQFIDNVLGVTAGCVDRREFEMFDTRIRRCRRHALRSPGCACWPPATSCTRRWARRSPSWIRASTRDSAPAWAAWCPTASSWALPPARKRGGRAARKRWRGAERRARGQEQARATTRALTPLPKWPTTTRLCFKRAQRVIPAASTRRCAPSARSAARRASSRARGRLSVGRRGPALHRLHRLVGADDPRPRPPAVLGCGADAARTRLQLRRAHRGRDPSWPRS